MKVTVGICLKGHTPPESYHDRMIMHYRLGCLEAEQFYTGANPRYVFNLCSVGEIFVSFAREQLAKAALDQGSDYLLMIDDDMLAPADLFLKLVKHNVDIVAPLAFTRNPPHKAVMYQALEGFDPSVNMPYFITDYVKNYPRNKLVECDAVGFGAVLIKTDVFRKMKAPWFMGVHGAGTGEDIYFCTMAKKVGARVFMDTATKLGHLSHPKVITEEYKDQFDAMTEDQKEKYYGKFQKYESLELSK